MAEPRTGCGQGREGNFTEGLYVFWTARSGPGECTTIRNYHPGAARSGTDTRTLKVRGANEETDQVSVLPYEITIRALHTAVRILGHRKFGGVAFPRRKARA
jgi:hypothetical protein